MEYNAGLGLATRVNNVMVRIAASLTIFDVIAIFFLAGPSIIAGILIYWRPSRSRVQELKSGSEGIWERRARSGSGSSAAIAVSSVKDVIESGSKSGTPSNQMQRDLDSFNTDIYFQSPDDPNFYESHGAKKKQQQQSSNIFGSFVSKPTSKQSYVDTSVVNTNSPNRNDNNNNNNSSSRINGTLLSRHVANNQIVQPHHPYNNKPMGGSPQTIISDLTGSPQTNAMLPLTYYHQQHQQNENNLVSGNSQHETQPVADLLKDLLVNQSIRSKSSITGLGLSSGAVGGDSSYSVIPNILLPDRSGSVAGAGTDTLKGAAKGGGSVGKSVSVSISGQSVASNIDKSLKNKITFKQFVNNFYRTLGTHGIRVQLLRRGKLVYRFLKLDRDHECLFWHTGEKWYKGFVGGRREWPVKNIVSVNVGMRLYLESTQGRVFTLEVEPSELIVNIKKKVSMKDTIDDYLELVLTHKGKILPYDKTLVQLGIEHGSTLIYSKKKKMLNSNDSISSFSRIGGGGFNNSDSNSSLNFTHQYQHPQGTLLQSVDRLVKNHLVNTGPYGFELILKSSNIKKVDKVKQYMLYVERESERDFFVKNFQFMIDNFELTNTVMRSVAPATNGSASPGISVKVNSFEVDSNNSNDILLRDIDLDSIGSVSTECTSNTFEIGGTNLSSSSSLGYNNIFNKATAGAGADAGTGTGSGKTSNTRTFLGFLRGKNR
jgi:hypothetical protein